MSFIFDMLLGFVWAFTLITTQAINPTGGFVVPWVTRRTDEQGRPAKGQINFNFITKGK